MEPKRLDKQTTINIMALIYGTPGTGKTRLSATAPNPIILECDPGGALSIQDSGLLFFQIDSMGDFRSAWAWLVLNQDAYSTIVVDGFTRLQILSINELVESDPKANKLEVRRRDWGLGTRMMMYALDGLMKLPKDVVLTCTERLRDDEIRHLKVIVPDITPALSNLINRYCRFMGRLYIENIRTEAGRTFERRLQTFNDGQVWAKDTSGRLPPTIAQPNLTSIFHAMRSPIPVPIPSGNNSLPSGETEKVQVSPTTLGGTSDETT